MLEIKNPSIDPKDLFEKIKTEIASAQNLKNIRIAKMSANSLGGHIKTIESSIIKIQERLQPKHDLPQRLKDKFFFLRFHWAEHFILRLYNLFTREQKETTYHLTMVCKTLLQACVILQSQIEELTNTNENSSKV